MCARAGFRGLRERSYLRLHFLALYRPRARGMCDILSVHTGCVPTYACVPMMCPLRLFRTRPRARLRSCTRPRSTSTVGCRYGKWHLFIESRRLRHKTNIISDHCSRPFQLICHPKRAVAHALRSAHVDRVRTDALAKSDGIPFSLSFFLSFLSFFLSFFFLFFPIRVFRAT